MSVFRNIRIYPDHGARSATLTWEMAVDSTPGDVYVAYSETGTDGTWQIRNADAPVPSEVGTFEDDSLVINKSTQDAFYRFLLTDDDGVDHFSEPMRIMGDLTPREYGILRAMIHHEFTSMRVVNGFPVWHCIPKAHGKDALSMDPDTDSQSGKDCDVTDPEVNSYGLPFQGGFYPPVLTWMRVMRHNEGLQDDPEEFSPSEINMTSARLMAFPRPARGHMIVNPSTDERWVVTDEIKPARLRGVAPVAFNVTLDHLNQRDERYKFPVPFIDTKEYRRIPYWTTQTLA